MPTVVTSYSGESYPHRIIFSCAAKLEEQLRENPNQPAIRLSFVLMSFMALEAYLNFVGDKLFADIWAKERTFFRGKDYPGVLGKLKFIAEKAGVTLDARTQRIVEQAKQLRDDIAHSRPVPYEFSVEHPADEEPPFKLTGWVVEKITAPVMEEMLPQVAATAEALHAGLVKVHGDREIFVHPFSGFSEMAVWGTHPKVD